MRFYVYLGATGDQRTVALLHSELQLEESETRALRRLLPNGEPEWIWRTKYVPVISGSPEDVVPNFLLSHKHVLPVIDRYRSQLDGISVFIIAQHDEGDEPRGYSFSEEAVSLLAEFGASLEIDAVRSIEPA